MKINARRSDCPVSFGLDIFGDKWTLLILRDIMFYNRTRFSDFAPWEHIATNILTDRLQRLEQTGIIVKQRDEVLKNQFVYSVTDSGKDLLPTLVEMSLWGLANDALTPTSKAFIERIKTDKAQVAKEMIAAIKADSFMEYRQTHMGIPSPA